MYLFVTRSCFCGADRVDLNVTHGGSVLSCVWRRAAHEQAWFMADAVKLTDAYAPKSPEATRELYERWAESYDTDFVEAHNYEYHHGVASAFLAAGGSTDLVLDVGCGTGLVGVALRSRGVREVHGFDISPAMLAKAAEKTLDEGEPVYGELAEVDLTLSPTQRDRYPGIVSAGTFTHGHLGPDSLDNVLAMAASGGLLAIGVNSQLFNDEGGFGQWLSDAAQAGRITDGRVETVRVYADGLGATQDNDVGAANASGTVMLFRKA